MHQSINLFEAQKQICFISFAEVFGLHICCVDIYFEVIDVVVQPFSEVIRMLMFTHFFLFLVQLIICIRFTCQLCRFGWLCLFHIDSSVQNVPSLFLALGFFVLWIYFYIYSIVSLILFYCQLNSLSFIFFHTLLIAF